MPNVTSQNLFAVLPSMINIIRGQATSANVTLHKNFVGNPLPAALMNEVVVEYIDGNNQVIKTQSLGANTLVYGTGETANQIAIEITAEESAALNLSQAGISGELYVRVSITEASNIVVMPKLKVGNIYDAGDNIGEIVASRFTVPSTVYKVSGLGNGPFASNHPAAGEMLFNSSIPAQITMVKVSNQDDKGFKNQWLETVLGDRIGVDGLTNSIFFTNINNTSEYSLFRITNYSRIDVNGNQSDTDLSDAIQLGVIYEGNSTSAGDAYSIAVGDALGIFTESYQGLLSQGIQITTPSHLGGVDGVRELTFTGSSVTSVAGVNATDGELTIDIAPGQKGQKGEIGAKGEVGQKGDDGSTAYQVYADGMANPLNESDWLNSLIGDQGQKGEKGEIGAKGEVGEKGDDGQKGDDGLTAYEVYTNTNGGPNPLNAVDWLNSLVGDDGPDGAKGEIGQKGEVGVGQKGEDGAVGAKGEVGNDSTVPGPKGDTGAGVQGAPGETPIAKNFMITVDSVGAAGNKYYVDGVQQDSLTLVRGFTYTFNQTMPSNATHPLYLSLTQDGWHNSGAQLFDGWSQAPAGGVAGTDLISTYTPSLTVVGPQTVYYFCGNHPNMGGQIEVDTLASGADGAAGAKGEAGQKGEAGTNGANGSKGEVGVGQKGDTGDTGTTGAKGEAGQDSNVVGPKGEDGGDGLKGQKGMTGDTGGTGVKGEAGGDGVKGEAGTNGDKGEAGTNGSNGTKGDTGDTGGTGAKGEVGEAGSKGEASTQAGAKGEAGIQGNKGEVGAGQKGEAGTNGDKGEAGTNGSNGTKGEAGQNGSNGVGEAGAKGEAGENGSKGEAGQDSNVAGAKGEAGQKGEAGTNGSNGSNGAKGEVGAGQKGEAGTNGSNGVKGEAGQNGSNGVGEAGAKGEAGENGSKGEAGQNGSNGSNGAKGETGQDSNVVGPKGEVGEAGSKGEAGETGPKGEAGVGQKGEAGTNGSNGVGEAGAKGEAGENGSKGEAGQNGSNGSNGAKGETGQDSNVVGPKGEVGEAGSKGEAGETGPKGEAGTNGSNGTKGAPGQNGSNGSNGAKGEVGETGAKGEEGASVTGAKGEAGQNGSNGSNGVKGEAGQNGSNGSNGSQGDTGDTGAKGEVGETGPKGEVGVGDAGTKGEVGVGQKGNKGEVGSGGGGGNLYFARVEYTSTQALGGVEFLDPSGNGDFLTAGANVGTIAGNNVDLTFSNEVTPPKEIIAYGYQANNSRYVITQLDGGGNNASFYALGAGESAHSSTFGIGNQVTTDIMTQFGTAKLTLDISMANLDAVRNAGGFGQETKEAHAFIMFRF